MGNLYIEEYAEIPTHAGQGVQCGTQPPVVDPYKFAFSTEAKSNAFNVKTKFVRLHTDAICSYLFGVNPTATTSHSRMPADHTEIFGVGGGAGALKVSVISNS